MVLQRLSVLVLLALWASGAEAALSVSPNILEAEEYPGGMQTFNVSLQNDDQSTLDCSIAVYSMRIMGEGLPTAVEDAPRSCRDWIRPKEPTFVLGPKSGKQVIFDLKCPRETSGGYYAIIAFDGKDSGAANPVSAGDEGGIKASIRFAHRVYVVVMLTVKGGEIQAIVDAGAPVFRNLKDGRSISLEVPVRNRGNIHTRIVGNAEIRSKDGQVLSSSRLASGKGFLLPMHERLLMTEEPLNLTDGIYQAIVALQREDVQTPMTTAFPFEIRNGAPVIINSATSSGESTDVPPGFILKPPTLNMTVNAGATQRLPLEIINLTKQNLPVRLEVLEWNREADVQDLVSRTPAAHGHSGVPLLKVEPAQFALPPLGKRRVLVSAAGNANLKGDVYAAITGFRNDVKLSETDKALARRSSLVLVKSSQPTLITGEITDLSVPRKDASGLIFEAVVANMGDVGFNPDATLSLRDARGALVDKVTDPENANIMIQAGGSRRHLFTWTRILPPGEYVTEFSVRIDPNAPALSRKGGFRLTEDNKIVPVATAAGTNNTTGASAKQ